MAWSRYQNDIFEYGTSLDGDSFAISAVAGSGKTTTEVELARRISAKYPEEKILFLAFNRQIVEKLTRELEEYPSIRCYTLHSLGLGVLRRSKMNININENKYRNYIRDNFRRLQDGSIPEDSRQKWVFISNCDELLRLSRINMVQPGDTARVSEIAFRHGIIPVANEVEAVASLLQKAQMLLPFRTKTPGLSGYDIDYTDMICLPLTDSFFKFIFRYDTVFIDEAQDLNEAQQHLMLSSVKQGGRFIAAGDPSQSINSFAGAMNDSFDVLVKRAGREFPLSVNYRCGSNIILEAQKLVPRIEAYEDAEAGVVEHTDSLASTQPGDMVLCRKTAPLLDVALKMMSLGKSAFIKGQDIAEKMLSFIDRIDSDEMRPLTMDMLYDRLDQMLERLIGDLRERGVMNIQAHPQFIDMVDKVNALKQIGTHCSTPGELRELLGNLFADTVTGNAVILSTVHKAKGLEADNVFIICPELLPMRLDGQQPWEVQQEMNLKYVAVTRAKKRLVWVDVSEHEINQIEVA